MMVLDIVDESTAGQRQEAWRLEVPDERLPLREVIRRRVFQEVAEHNAQSVKPVRWLVRPTEVERALNGERSTGHRQLDPWQQYLRALEAFRRNGYIVLVEERQVEDLDEELQLSSGAEITFLRLVPLVGG